jgi:tetratricopeptide (TPR) repeat protein
VLHFVDGANPQPDLTTIGGLLKVDYVLYGEMDKVRQRVAIKLIRVRDGASLFAENYDEKLDNIFQLEESLCPKVLANLLVNLDHEETQRLRKRYTENPRAYEAFLKAHYFMGKATKEDTNRGIDYFKQAIDLDPKYAMAYAGLSDCYMKLGNYGVPPKGFVPVSRAAVMKALELDDTVAYSHSMLGRIAFQYDWDFPRAESEYARARQLEPSLVHAWYSNYLLTLNRMAEADVEARKFEDFLPFAPANINLAQHFYLTRQYDQAVDLLTRKVEMNPLIPMTHEWLGMVYEQQGRTRQAVEEFQKANQLSNGARGLGALGHLYAVSGKKDDAQKAIQDLDELAKRAFVSSYQNAVIYAGLGEKDESFKYLQKSFDERSLSAPLLRFDPRLNELRNDPRFQDLMRRAGMLN